MTSPTLPSFITPSTRRIYTRNVTSPARQPQPSRRHRKPQPKPSFFERHGDTIVFLWTCILVAALVYTAFS